jgi:hypothetical protein
MLYKRVYTREKSPGTAFSGAFRSERITLPAEIISACKFVSEDLQQRSDRK